MGGESEPGRHLDALYMAVKNGAAVDRQAAFDVAVNKLECRPLHAGTRELAEASVTDGDETRLASAVRATGLRGMSSWSGRTGVPVTAVETWAGDQGWTGGIFPSDAADDFSAFVAVAEQARQAIMESLRYQSTGRKWPTCPAHDLGASPCAHHRTGAWWCDGDGGHVAAEIGR